MKAAKKIAVTGGMASGKSSTCRFLEECGAYYVDADSIVHALLEPESILNEALVSLFGHDVAADRTALARAVFDDHRLLQSLEEILHPRVMDMIEKIYNEVIATQKYSLFVVEVPLLFEASFESFFDTIIVVTADDEICRKRYGDSIEYDRRMKRQLPPEEKAARATMTIANNGTLDALRYKSHTCYDILVE